MSTTLTYSQRYNQWAEFDYNLDAQFEIEYEIINRFINGLQQYQQLIFNHISSDMFTDKDLRAICEIVKEYVQKNGINKLNAYDLICSLEGKQIKYVQYIEHLKECFICSGDAENWLIRLHNSYEKRLYREGKTKADFLKIESELNKYRLQTVECKLFDVAMGYLDTYDELAKNIVKTYYKSIDILIGGLQGGNFVILAGSTGMGKTATALNLVINMARHGKKVLFFSLEMTTDELLTRIIAIEASISFENIRNRNLSEEEMAKYVAYVDSKRFKQFQNLITIPAITSLNITKIEEIVQKTKADIIFVDYLGLVKGDSSKQNTYEQISDISRRLKLLAIETNKPLIALHQLNRDMKNRPDKHPTLSDIRDSGKIEQDADFIWFVYRPAYFDISADKTAFEFILAKSRHTGKAGNIAKLKFDGQYQRITDPLGETKGEYKQCKMI